MSLFWDFYPCTVSKKSLFKREKCSEFGNCKQKMLFVRPDTLGPQFRKFLCRFRYFFKLMVFVAKMFLLEFEEWTMWSPCVTGGSCSGRYIKSAHTAWAVSGLVSSGQGKIPVHGRGACRR